MRFVAFHLASRQVTSAASSSLLTVRLHVNFGRPIFSDSLRIPLERLSSDGALRSSQCMTDEPALAFLDEYRHWFDLGPEIEFLIKHSGGP